MNATQFLLISIFVLVWAVIFWRFVLGVLVVAVVVLVLIGLVSALHAAQDQHPAHAPAGSTGSVMTA
jgi:hypothetical protein